MTTADINAQLVREAHEKCLDALRAAVVLMRSSPGESLQYQDIRDAASEIDALAQLAELSANGSTPLAPLPPCNRTSLTS